jgi:alpha,alpha-trehalose phosphorylase
VQSIIAAEVGYRDLALRYFHNALFVDLADLHGNVTDGVHVASTGGVWMCLAYGFAGMRDYNGVITFDPRLPESWAGLTFQLSLRGSRIQVEVTADLITFTVVSGQGAEVSVRGQRVTVSPEAPVRVPLVDQGPRIETPLPHINGDRRPDGTLITASVPQPSSVAARR